MKKILFIIYASLFVPAAHACTAFGAVTESGTIIAKNRDYFYIPQHAGLIASVQQFDHWYSNPYDHRNAFYGLTYTEGVSMGINQNGLTAIEEDILPTAHTKNVKEYKAFQQQEGTPDGLVLQGILQNFNTVDEMIPYIPKIFSEAASDFYQFADAQKILTVEVAHGKFTYHLLSQPRQYFTHTNTYLSPAFMAFNNLAASQDSVKGSQNRLDMINSLIPHTEDFNINIDTVAGWFKNTYSHQHACLNTSIFRSDLQGLNAVHKNTPNDKIYGTVASMVVSNQGDLKKSYIYLMLLDGITTQSDGKQLIKYHVLNTTLDKLFDHSILKFTEGEFLRNPPVNNICH